MAKNDTSKYSTVSVDLETQKKIGFIAHAMGLSQKQLQKQVYDNLFCLASNFAENLNLEWEISHLEKSLKIFYSGKSNLYLGSFNIPESATKAECDKAIKKALTAQIKAKKGVKA